MKVSDKVIFTLSNYPNNVLKVKEIKNDKVLCSWKNQLLEDWTGVDPYTGIPKIVEGSYVNGEPESEAWFLKESLEKKTFFRRFKK